MSELPEILDEIIPAIYQEVREAQNRPYYYNMARSNQCHVLSLALHSAMENRGLPTAREFHMRGDRLWHFLIRHSDPHVDLTAEDLVTDLNPWQFETHQSNSTYFHGTRGELMDTLESAGAPEWFVSLRGTATVIRKHVTLLMPSQILTHADQLTVT